MTIDRVRATAKLTGKHMDEILAMFKPGARIALAVWTPGKPEQDFILIHPEARLDDAIDALVRRRDGNSTVGRTGSP